VGYNDVVDAWNYYLAHENKGRGVVLIGHSQGSGVLTRMIVAEVDGKPVQKQLISALLLGTSLGVEKGKDTGTFKSIPTCKSANQTGCVIAYGRSATPSRRRPTAASAGCEPGDGGGVRQPGNLSGGKGEFHAYLSNAAAQIASSSAPPPAWVKGKPNPTTPFVSVPGLLTGQCVSKNGFNYLEAHVNAEPGRPRADDIAGDVRGPAARWPPTGACTSSTPTSPWATWSTSLAPSRRRTWRRRSSGALPSPSWGGIDREAVRVGTWGPEC
jgi:hypothetical protein